MTTDNLGPSPAQMGDTMTVNAGEWTPLDDHGTQIYVYGEQSVDIAVQYGAEEEIRELRAAFEEIDWLLDQYRGAKALRQGAQAIVDRVRGLPRYAPGEDHEHDGYCLKAGGVCSPEALEARP